MTLRARLTLIYGGLFLIAGVTLLGTTYALFDWQLSNMPQTLVTRGEPLATTRQMFVFTGDALLLERLVHNLVENGIRHNTGPGGQVEITTHTHDDGHIEVRVRNTGPVVPHHEIPALFEPFRRLPTVHPPKGAGLGLSIVRSITHAHGGEATARPQDEGGLVVVVRLPGVTRCAVPPRSSCGPPTWPG